MGKKAFDFPHRCAVEREMQRAKQCVMPNWHTVRPALRNLMILFVPQRETLGLETVQQGQDTVNKCRAVISRPLPEHGFPREALPALACVCFSDWVAPRPLRSFIPAPF